MMCQTLIFIYINSFSFHNTPMMPVQKKKLRSKEFKECVQIHTASKQQSQDLTPGSQDPESKILWHSTK